MDPLNTLESESLLGTKTVSVSPKIQSAIADLWGVIRQAGEILVAIREDNTALNARVTALEQQEGDHEQFSQYTQEYGEQLERALEQQEKEVESLHRTLKEYVETILMKDGQLSDRANTISLNQRLIGQMSEELEHQKQFIHDLREKADVLAEAQAELDSMKHEAEQTRENTTLLEKALAANAALEEDFAYIKLELVRRNTELHGRIKEGMHYRERVAELENKLLEFDRSRATLQQNEMEILILREELERLGETHRQEQERWEGEMSTQKEQTKAAEDREKEQEGALLEQMRTHQDELKDRMQIIEVQQQHIAEYSEQIVHLQALLAETEHQLPQIQEKVQQLLAELEGERMEKARMADLITTLQREQEQTAKKFDEVSRDKSRLQSEYDTLLARCQELEAQTREQVQGTKLLSMEERKELTHKVKVLLEKVEHALNE